MLTPRSFPKLPKADPPAVAASLGATLYKPEVIAPPVVIAPAIFAPVA